MDAVDDYRSPAFNEYNHIKPEEEYRSPAFREYDHIKPEEEYRSPAFNDKSRVRLDERPMFSITCVACGQDAMVPFLPEEKDDPMCRDCYKEHKELLRKEQEEEARRAAEEEAAKAALKEDQGEGPEESTADSADS